MRIRGTVRRLEVEGPGGWELQADTGKNYFLDGALEAAVDGKRFEISGDIVKTTSRGCRGRYIMVVSLVAVDSDR